MVIYAAKGSTSETYANTYSHTFYTSAADELATTAVVKAESTLSQSDLNNAQSLVNNVEDTTEKATLQNRLDAVQNKINEQQKEADATSAVVQAESTHSQTDVDNANSLVNALSAGTVKTNCIMKIMKELKNKNDSLAHNNIHKVIVTKVREYQDSMQDLGDL